MLINAKVGSACWAVMDWWETFCAVKVTIISQEEADVIIKPENANEVCVRWTPGGGEYSEDYVMDRHTLFASKAKAVRMARKETRKAKKG